MVNLNNNGCFGGGVRNPPEPLEILKRDKTAREHLASGAPVVVTAGTRSGWGAVTW